MLFGISTYFLSKERVLPLIEEAFLKGIRHFEVGFEVPYLDFLNENFFEKIENLRSLGVSFSIHAPWIECNLGSLFREVRDFTKRRIISSIDLAERWNLNPVILHPGLSFVKEKNSHKEAKDNFMEELRSIVSYAEKKGVRILLENVPFVFSFFSSLEEFEDFRGRLDIRICYDMGHSLLMKRGEPEEVQSMILSEVIEHRSDIEEIHFHNNHGKKDEHLLYSGILDLKKILLGLKEKGFEGIVMVESSDIERFGLDFFFSWIRDSGLL